MGVFIAFGATAKAVEPLWTRSTFQYSKLLCFGITCVGQVLTVLLSWLLSAHLQPHTENHRMSYIILDEVTPADDEDEQDGSLTPSDRSEDLYLRELTSVHKFSSPSR